MDNNNKRGNTTCHDDADEGQLLSNDDSHYENNNNNHDDDGVLLPLRNNNKNARLRAQSEPDYYSRHSDMFQLLLLDQETSAASSSAITTTTRIAPPSSSPITATTASAAADCSYDTIPITPSQGGGGATACRRRRRRTRAWTEEPTTSTTSTSQYFGEQNAITDSTLRADAPSPSSSSSWTTNSYLWWRTRTDHVAPRRRRDPEEETLRENVVTTLPPMTNTALSSSSASTTTLLQPSLADPNQYSDDTMNGTSWPPQLQTNPSNHSTEQQQSGPVIANEIHAIHTTDEQEEDGDNDAGQEEHREDDDDQQLRQARMRWIQINRRFHVFITAVSLAFTVLIFTILLCWVALTASYALNFNKPCDVPLKSYYWLVSLQLVLDVFRTNILRMFFRWDNASAEPIPTRVVLYNIAYLVYALLVLRLGILSVFVWDGSSFDNSSSSGANNDNNNNNNNNSTPSTCRDTAPALFITSTIFVSLSLAAWALIVFGYIVPFLVAATLLTCNGYHPGSSDHPGGEAGNTTHAVFPAAYSQTGAPPGCIEQLPVMPLSTFPPHFPRECCICMEDFTNEDVIVCTACHHVFHRACCREWLRQSRTCPVCRTDIPSTLLLLQESLSSSNTAAETSLSVVVVNDGASEPSQIPLGPTGRPVASLWRMWRRTTTNSSSQDAASGGGGGDASSIASPTITISPANTSPVDNHTDLEQGPRSHQS